MTGTGNDIVSLGAINAARTNQYKFYSKILSDSEIPLYNEFNLAVIPFENFVWLLWSVKESAYKLLQRHEPALLFTPVKFVVKKLQIPENYAIVKFVANVEATGFENNSSINGLMSFGQHVLYSRSIIYRNLIVSVVSNHDSFENTCWGVKSIDDPEQENQSKEVRLFLLNRLKQIYGDFDFRIVKNPHGCPILLKETEETSIPVSLSHHENLIGYSFLKHD
ncbi:4'-phosphopantetheinyl transferase superfamily protein [Mucilaginibacter sp. BJC16-A38]|uniref:4'-phosphopantetheinyl transferase superfamily protein n=1 Tax=Mucilaginibacter phenanthrenivorans TaxID=1234842 RepID=UPI0021589863|nr:4'-phosphopantetheinyl transferase superfamily protein [Mucilaginibacter phenanthrenivorans]MCR8561185.1 4'-phosphopantetheinyl transferase superfamily protein [Mucilaginibacter phenanthrenivorans]